MAQRKGKKVGTLTVRLKSRAVRNGIGTSTPTLDVELRLDAQTGSFFAEYAGVTYEAKTIAELRTQVAEVADKQIAWTWHRYIEIDYSAEFHPLDAAGRTAENGTYDRFGIGTDRSAPREGRYSHHQDRDGHGHAITAVNLRWNVVEYTDPYETPEKPGVLRRAERRVFASGETGNPREHDDADMPIGVLPWTAEREATLRAIRDALQALDARLSALFAGDPTLLAGKIEALDIRLLGPYDE